MPDDNRPRITRTTSLFPGARASGSARTSFSNVGGSAYQPSPRRATPYEQAIGRFQEQTYPRSGEKPAAPAATGGSFYRQFLEDQLSQGSRLAQNISASSTTDIGATAEQTASIFGPLDVSSVDPTTQFLFDRAAPINPETGSRTGVLESRGVFGSADSLERQIPAGQTVTTGANENRMTIAAGVLWLRNLAARDTTAYNKLVVLLRNAGYGSLSSNDAELPLNGYSQQVGVAFALAANDVAQAGQGGDNRTLLEYLTDRGKSYADFIAQEQADQAAAEAARTGPLSREYQDPATLRAAAKDAAVSALGRKLTDEEEARFEAAFRAKEDSFYDAIDKARADQGVYRGYQPDVAGQVDDFLDGPQFETEAAANRIGEYANVFLNLIGGSG